MDEMRTRKSRRFIYYEGCTSSYINSVPFIAFEEIRATTKKVKDLKVIQDLQWAQGITISMILMTTMISVATIIQVIKGYNEYKDTKDY